MTKPTKLQRLINEAHDIDFNGLAEEAMSKEEDLCVWKAIYFDRSRLQEGYLRNCQLFCDGYNQFCEHYDPLSNFNEDDAQSLSKMNRK